MFIFVITLVIALTIIGIKYVQTGTSQYISMSDIQLKKRRDFIKENRDVFGVSNNGTSLDKREVYKYRLEDLGLSEARNENR